MEKGRFGLEIRRKQKETLESSYIKIWGTQTWYSTLCKSDSVSMSLYSTPSPISRLLNIARNLLKVSKCQQGEIDTLLGLMVIVHL